jgi:alpha-galactosidase
MDFGARPGHPLLYTVAATGDRPMSFTADGLPAGLQIDSSNGRISGTIATPGETSVTVHASNALGTAARKLKLIIGDKIALTPPMGWNSWNCWHGSIDQEKILRAARAMASTGLVNHGWSYINTDDGWQGMRGGELNAIQGNPKSFPDIKAMCDEIHSLGLKAGIYSTPWVSSYAGHVGGSSENEQGTWNHAMTKGPMNQKILPHAIGRYLFDKQDAEQWAAWGVDYLKYDWAPNEMPETKAMYDALNDSGRDIALSLSNNTTNSLFKIIPEMSQIANCWRISGDIGDSWPSIVGHGFNQDKWAPFAGPGRWNDPDMLEIGANGGGTPKKLTADEQFTHVSLWCLLSAPLLLGCDMDHLTPFTLGLITNDEVLAVDQDALGKQGTAVRKNATMQVVAKDMEDGSKAVGLFNLGPAEQTIGVDWSDLKISGQQTVRDLWRQKDLGKFGEKVEATVPSHGVILIRISSAITAYH